MPRQGSAARRSRRHHKAMHSSAHGRGHDKKLRERKRERGDHGKNGRMPPKRGKTP